MSYRIEGWVIIDTRDGDRWGKLYETEAGAKKSFNDDVREYNRWRTAHKAMFNDQKIYILQPLVLLEGEI